MARGTIPVGRRTLATGLALALASLLAACGSSSSSSSGAKGVSRATRASRPTTQSGGPLTVLAAASLTKVFPAIDPGAHYTFGGSGALETDVEQGAPADVYASASPKQAKALYAKGLAAKPVEFATNQLVMIVPKDNPAHIGSVADVTKPGVKIVICDATVPCGDYARNAFKNLGITSAAMKNVVSQTTDVTQTVADVALGQADVGFVYITDAKAADGKVAVVKLPAGAKPEAQDYITVVKASHRPAAARAFIARVLSPAGQSKLRAAGFGTR